MKTVIVCGLKFLCYCVSKNHSKDYCFRLCMIFSLNKTARIEICYLCVSTFICYTIEVSLQSWQLVKKGLHREEQNKFRQKLSSVGIEYRNSFGSTLIPR